MKEITHSQWKFTFFAMTTFTLVKISALICACWVMANVNIGVGMLLFTLGTIYRLTWSFDVSNHAAKDKALELCLMFLTNVNTIDEEKQAELANQLHLAAMHEEATSVMQGGFASAFDHLEDMKDEE